MKETVNKSVEIPTKLSEMQKAILECLWNCKESYLCPAHTLNITTVSWFVAERFNRGHNDRIWDQKGAKIEVAKRINGKNLIRTFQMIENLHRQPKLLTPKHRASFSRSVKRLEDRGLIKRYVALRHEKRGDKWFLVWYVGDGRTRYLRLTNRGKEVCSKMLTVSKEK